MKLDWCFTALGSVRLLDFKLQLCVSGWNASKNCSFSPIQKVIFERHFKSKRMYFFTSLNAFFYSILPYIFFTLKMKNLDALLCLDQGPIPGHVPVAYTCHYYSSQVSTCNETCTNSPNTCQSSHTPVMYKDLSDLCLFSQHTFYQESSKFYIGGIQSHKYNDNRCLVDPGTGNVPGLYPCKEALMRNMGIYWDFKQVL